MDVAVGRAAARCRRLVELLYQRAHLGQARRVGGAQDQRVAAGVGQQRGLERVVRLSLRGVLTVEIAGLMNFDNMYFEGLLPIDNRINTVDVRDVAHAFSAATTAPILGETLLIGGDTSHRLLQGDIAPAMAAAMGLVGGLATGLPGNPDSDADWFATDWMDTTRAQEALGFQHHSWSDLLLETADKAGWARPLLRVAAPLSREFLKRRHPYHGRSPPYADPWGAVAAKWGDPRPESNRT